MRPSDGVSRPMLSSSDELIRDWIVEAEDNEVRRSGNERAAARNTIASKIGISAGTIENLRRRRIKDLRGSIRDRIVDFMVGDLEKEMARLQHNLEVARLCADRPDADAVIEAQTLLARAKRLIEEKP
jgi:hypothetical protein